MIYYVSLTLYSDDLFFGQRPAMLRAFISVHRDYSECSGSYIVLGIKQ